MSEWAVLGLVALALYLMECVSWVDAAAVACFKSGFRSRWKCGQGSTFPGNEGGGLLLRHPMRLEGSLVVCRVWPVSLSPEGVTNVAVNGGTCRSAEPRYISFEELRTIRVELGEIIVNGQRLARLSSQASATHVARQIERIWQTRPEQRASQITAVVQEALDENGAAARWARFVEETRTLRALCFALFTTMFIVCPAVLTVLGPYPAWAFLAAGILGITVATSIAYFRTHAALYPESRYDRWVHAVSMTMLPVAAIRCLDKLSRDALCRYGSVVVSPMLCGVDNAVPVLRQQFIDVSRASGDFDDVVSTSAADCARWFRRLIATETKAALDRFKLPVLNAPRREDDTMICYCPRCHAQFGRSDSSSCPSCCGVPLIAFCAHDTPLGNAI